MLCYVVERMQRSRRAPKFDRKYERYQLDVRLIVKTKTATFHGRTKNLAEGGMGATVAGEIPLHEVVEVQFQLPGSSEPVVLAAEVRFRQGFQYGFKFQASAGDPLKLLRNGLNNVPPDE